MIKECIICGKEKKHYAKGKCMCCYQKAFSKTEKYKQAVKRYQQSEKGKLSMKRYTQSDKGKQTIKKIQNSDKAKETKRKYLQSDKGKASLKKSQAKYTLNNIDKVRGFWRKNGKKYRESEKYKGRLKLRWAINNHRFDVLDKLGNKCNKCNSKDSLEIHHNTYDSNDLDDLTLLCRKCHRELHKKQ